MKKNYTETKELGKTKLFQSFPGPRKYLSIT